MKRLASRFAAAWPFSAAPLVVEHLAEEADRIAPAPTLRAGATRLGDCVPLTAGA